MDFILPIFIQKVPGNLHFSSLRCHQPEADLGGHAPWLWQRQFWDQTHIASSLWANAEAALPGLWPDINPSLAFLPSLFCSLQFPYHSPLECACVLSCFSRVPLFAIPMDCSPSVQGILCNPLSRAFSRQEYWSGLPCPPPGDLPDPGIEPTSLRSPALAGRFFLPPVPHGKPFPGGISL